MSINIGSLDRSTPCFSASLLAWSAASFTVDIVYVAAEGKCGVKASVNNAHAWPLNGGTKKSRSCDVHRARRGLRSRHGVVYKIDFPAILKFKTRFL